MHPVRRASDCERAGEGGRERATEGEKEGEGEREGEGGRVRERVLQCVAVCCSHLNRRPLIMVGFKIAFHKIHSEE